MTNLLSDLFVIQIGITNIFANSISSNKLFKRVSMCFNSFERIETQLTSTLVVYKAICFKMSIYDEILIYIMRKDHKVKKPKPILTIDSAIIQQTNNLSQQKQSTELVMVKPLRSTKNQFQMRQMFFRSHKHQEGIIRKYSLSLNQLEKQKEELIESIHILKTGAISAIAEKEDNISRLKEAKSSQNEQEMQIYQQVLKQSKCTQRQLQTSLKQLHHQLHQERQSLTDILEQKQTRIQELENLVNNLRSYVEQLQINEQKIINQIKSLENKICHLTRQLQEYTIAVAVEEYTEKTKQNHNKKNSSFSSIIPYCKSSSNLLDALHTNDFSISIERQYAQKVQEIMQRHLQQIAEIKEFYQNKISNIRNIYNAYIADELQNRSIQYKKQDSQVRVFEQDGIFDTKMNKYQSSSERCIVGEQTDKTETIQKISQPSVHILNEQINFANQYPHLHNQQNIGQASSQFTKEYFQDPYLFTKHKSLQSLKSVENKKIIKKDSCNYKMGKTEVTEPKSETQPVKKSQKGWQKTILFAAGLISGISITSIVNFAFKKKNVKNMLKYVKF